MRILHIINSLQIGGAERLVVDLLPFLNDQNIPSDLLLLNAVETSLTKEFAASSHCQIFSLNASEIYNPLLIFKIKPYLKEYDIIHIHLIPSLYWGAIAKFLSGSKTKLIYTEHTVIIKKRSNWFFRMVDRFIYSQIDKVICVSKQVEDSLHNHLKNESNNLVTITNGINLSRFSNALPMNRSELGLCDTDFVIVQASSFRPAKDQQTVIEAAKLLPTEFKIVLAGDGQNRIPCEKYALEIGAAKNTFFLGNQEDIPALLAMADVVLLSSHYEAFPLAVLEGMASQKPVVASNVSGLAELVGNTGILFEKGNAQELADIILKLKNEKAFYEKMATRCYSRSQEYSLKKMATEHITLYEAVFSA